MSLDVDGDRFDRLTERQQTCLRLAMLHRNSSEIGREIGASPNTVDKIMKGAMAKIGVSSRWEAARLFSEHEARAGGRSPAPQIPALPIDSASPDAARTDRDRMPWWRRLPVPVKGRERNDQGLPEILRWVALIALGTLALYVFAAAALNSLNEVRSIPSTNPH